MQPTILMCDPKHFDIKYEINPWMNTTNKANKQLALNQWHALKDAITSSGASVRYITPQECPDMVFSANAGLVYKQTFIPARFAHKERQSETVHWKKWFRDNNFAIKKVTETFEGAGDALFAGDILIGGYGFRSTRSVYTQIGNILDVEVRKVELVDPRFYHLDTCFCPLNAEHALYFPHAFSDQSRKLLEHTVNCYAVPEDEAERFACNAVVIDSHVILPEECPITESILNSLGFTTHAVAMTEFLKSGGATKCLTIRLDTGRENVASLPLIEPTLSLAT